jgi:hypothetical protein
MTSRRQSARRHARRALLQPAAGGHRGAIGNVPHRALILRAGRWGKPRGQAAAVGCPYDLAAPVHGGILASAAVAGRLQYGTVALLGEPGQQPAKISLTR